MAKDTDANPNYRWRERRDSVFCLGPLEIVVRILPDSNEHVVSCSQLGIVDRPLDVDEIIKKGFNRYEAVKMAALATAQKEAESLARQLRDLLALVPKP